MMMTTALTDIVVCVAASPVPQANIKEIEDAHQARRDADAANAEWGAKLKETCSNKLLVLQGVCVSSPYRCLECPSRRGVSRL
jgi:uncharacterized protein CbrC (UPF0167 family)